MIYNNNNIHYRATKSSIFNIEFTLNLYARLHHKLNTVTIIQVIQIRHTSWKIQTEILNRGIAE